MMLDVIRKHHLESRVILQSFDFRTLHAMKKLAPEIRRSALYEGAPKSFVEIAKEAEASIVSPEFTLSHAGTGAGGARGWTAGSPLDRQLARRLGQTHCGSRRRHH